MVQQHIGAARGARSEGRSDDGTAGKMGFYDLALEVLIEKIGGGHGPEPQRVVHALLAHSVEARTEVEKFVEVTWPERRRIGRFAQKKGTNELALPHDVT